MIVDPDFLDHWKTKMLINLLGDETAPQYVLRLWAHCQNRRQTKFDMPPEALKALCRFSGPANKLEASLSTSGFIRRSGSQVEISNWEEYNSSLIANWKNGTKGGRPKKPKSNPNETHGFPMGNPSKTDKIGLDGIGDNKQEIGDEPLIPDWLKESWEKWCLHILEKTGSKIGSVQAQQIAYELSSKDHGEVIKDIATSIRYGSINIRPWRQFERSAGQQASSKQPRELKRRSANGTA